MSKFRQNKSKEMPAVSTASLPDIVLLANAKKRLRREWVQKQCRNVKVSTKLTKIENKQIACFDINSMSGLLFTSTT